MRQVEQALQDLNFVYCELTSYLLLNSSPLELTTRRSKKQRSGPNITGGVSQVQIDRVCQYVIKALKGEGAGQSGPGSALSRPISATSYTSILPTVWALLNNADPSHADEILRAVFEHAIKSSSTSAVKRNTIEFLGRLVLVRNTVALLTVIELTVV